MCRELVGRTDPERVSASGKRVLPDFPASVTDRPSMFPWSFSDCAEWDVAAAPARVGRPVTSAVPVLLTSGAFDCVLLVRASDVRALRDVLLEQLQSHPAVRSTQTVFVLDERGRPVGAVL